MSLSVSQKKNKARQRLPDAQMGSPQSPLLCVVCGWFHAP